MTGSRDEAADSQERAVDLEAAREVLAALDAAQTYRSISELARPEAASVLQEMPYDPEVEHHQPSCVVVEPHVGTYEELHFFGRATSRRFDSLLFDEFNDPRHDELLNDLYHRLFLNGQNVAVVTNHGMIVDIALVLGAIVLAMTHPERRFGVLGATVGLEEMADHSNVLVSRMVTTRQAFGIPAISVLQHFCRTFLSVPQTSSRRRVRVDPELVRCNNLIMREELTARLRSGGQLVAMAASGSQDLSLAANLVSRVRREWRIRRGDEPSAATSLHLQPLYRGTIDLMLAAQDVLPIALEFEGPQPACVVGGISRVRTPDDCHEVMEWIAAAHGQATGVASVYHRQEDPLLEQVRAVLRR